MKRAHYILLLKRLSVLFIAYTLLRLHFLLNNYSYFSDSPVYSILKSFILGFRFDLIAITAINLPFIIFSLAPVGAINKNGYQSFLRYWFILSNVPFIFLNISDSYYFKFTGKRSTFDLTGMANDIVNQAWQLMADYWQAPALASLIILGVAIAYPRFPLKESVKTARYTPYIVLILTIGLSILILRGTTDRRPITLKQAFTIAPVKLGNLVLNTSFSFLYTIQSKGVESKNYFASDEECHQRIKKARLPGFRPDTTGKAPIKDNVVIIILESFGREYMGASSDHQGYTPFLDSLARQALFFPHCYANGRRSIEALPAILAGIPSLMDEPYVNSMYQNNDLHGLGSILRQHGYHTSFFHGGFNGTMSFDAFSAQAGFVRYIGMNEYPDRHIDYDGKWGIYDEPFMQFFARSLSETPQPFCSAIFTLSSHPPYTIPEKYQGVFPKGTLPIHETIGYTDFALKRFFETAKKTDWYDKTLFVITADHTQEHFEENYKNDMGDYLIPLLFFRPGQDLEGDADRLVQQVDITPSIVDYLGIPTPEQTLFGCSVFSPKTLDGFAINQSNGVYRLIRPDYFIQYSDNGLQEVQKNPFGTQQIPEPGQTSIIESETELLKAHIQYFNNGLINNRLFMKARN